MINLEQVKLSGFKSFIEPTAITFSHDSGLKYLSGENLVNKLGSNGAGKTSVFDSLFWCCYGVSTSGKRASDLLSWGGQQIEVETRWTIDDKQWRIKRTSPPERIEINGKPGDQAGIERLLKLSRLRFSQSVLFGQGANLFYDMSVPDRGALLDEIFDLQLWLRLADVASKREAKATGQLRAAESVLQYQRGRLEGMRDEEKLKADVEAWDNARDRELEEKLAEIDRLEVEFEEVRRKLVGAQHALAELPINKDLETTLRNLIAKCARLESEGKRINENQQQTYEEIKFYQNNHVCPTCNRVMREDSRQAHIERLKKTIDEARNATAKISGQINFARTDQQQIEGELSKTTRKRDHYNVVVASCNAEQKRIERERQRLLSDADQLADSPKHNPFFKQLTELRKDKRIAKQAVTTAEKEIESIQTTVAAYEYWKQGFRRVRLFLLKQVIAQLELEVASAASALGLPDWRISFSTEIETKSGTMRPGVHISINAGNKSGRDWSPGELQRVRLASQIGLATLIQRSAGVYYGFEIYDEPSNWLSSEGIEDLLELLRYRADNSKRSIWLVDQRGLYFAGFSETWLVTKRGSGSTIKLVGRSG